MSSGEASPSCRAKQASFRSGMRIRFTMKPGESFEVTVIFPNRFASATTAW